MVTKILSVLDVGFSEDYMNYFDDFLHLTETNLNGSICFDESHGGIQEQDHRGVVAIKLDNVQKEDLVTKKNRVAKRWSS